MGAQYPVQVSWKMINRSIGFKYIMIQQSMVIVVVVSSLVGKVKRLFGLKDCCERRNSRLSLFV